MSTGAKQGRSKLHDYKEWVQLLVRSPSLTGMSIFFPPR